MNAVTLRERLRRLQAVVTCRRIGDRHEWAASAWSANVGLVGVRAETPVEAVERALTTLEQRKRPAGTVLIARCSCGSTYTAAGWAGLHLVGYQQDGRRMFELRDCHDCHSSLAVEVVP
jgi:hypothetical protein